MEVMNRVRAIAADDLFALMETAAARCPAELFRPYRYRDPQRAGGERMAVLKAIDLAECIHCRAHGWPCDDHVPRASLGLAG
jgi:hypothetical protein